MQMLIKREVISWAKKARKNRLVRDIDSLMVVQIADGPEYVTGIQLSKLMNDRTWRQLTSDVTSYFFT